MSEKNTLSPAYESMDNWEFYASNLVTEYQQSTEEGLDIEEYKELFDSVSKLPKGELKKRFGDILFDIVYNAKQRADFPYNEPSDLEAIKALRKREELNDGVDKASLKSRIYGAWMGRICGCMLGKTVEGMRTNELVPFLTETGNYPMHRYIYRTDASPDVIQKYKYKLASRVYADEIDGMPVDDDTNYVVLAQEVICKYGRDFTPENMAKSWLDMQKKNAYCTAERVAFCNFVKGYTPPESAVYQNPFREWIGAQIRGDYFGYINPGNPELAAEMAWRDASISHVKNGIYGEMFASAMIAAAAVTSDVEKIILCGLGEIPHTSRLSADVTAVMESYKSGVSQADCFKMIHEKYDEYTVHGWCHTITNAMIVAASLLYGEGDFGRSVCMAVETGFDTDCNGATVGSVLGMANGIESIPEYWTSPFNDTLYTSIFGIDKVNITERADLTLSHVVIPD